MVYFALLVSDCDDIVLLQGIYCKDCIERKLKCEVYKYWTIDENGFREWYKMIGKAVRMMKCECKVQTKFEKMNIK